MIRQSTTRIVNDQYYTPPLAVYAVLPYLAPYLKRKGAIIEPSAGTGNVVRCLRSVGVRADRIIALERDPSQAVRCVDPAAIVTDTLLTEVRPYLGAAGCDLVIGNPPYSAAAEFVTWALRTVSPGGAVAFLLRVSFVGSIGRAWLFRQYPAQLLVLPRRPSFVHKRKANGQTATTDQYTYAWFVWRLGDDLTADAPPSNEWIEDDNAAVIGASIRAAGLKVPEMLHWRYVPPLVDADGFLLREAEYGPTP